MQQYHSYLEEILKGGVPKGDRTGTGTTSTFGVVRRYNISDNRLAAVQTKKLHLKTGFVEEDWMLSGDTNVKFLKENNCNIWDEWVKKGTGVYRPATLKEMERSYKRSHFGWDEPMIGHGALSGEGPIHRGDGFNVYERQYTGREYTHLHYICIEDHGQMLTQADRDELMRKFYTLIGIPTETVVEGELGAVYGKMFRAIDDYRVCKDDGVEAPALEKRGFALIDELARGGLLYHRVIDQFKDLMKGLRENPDSRRHILCPWNPAYLDEQALPPCHSFIQFWVRDLDMLERWSIMQTRYRRARNEHVKALANREDDKIIEFSVPEPLPMEAFSRQKNDQVSQDDELIHAYLDERQIPRRALKCLVYMRSNDAFLGAPYNLTFYSSLTHKIAHELNYYGEELIHVVGDAHIYDNHREQVALQLTRKSKEMPRLKINCPIGTPVLDLTWRDLEVIGYDPDPAIEAPVAV
ncbi:thymidylate synthase [Pseudomonas phage D6]|nr:thymidylate synthase [Pseudomonas phage D6]